MFHRPFCYEKNKMKKINPLYPEKKALVLISDKNYIKYASVTIQSIINNASEDKHYDIIILYDNDDITKIDGINPKDNVSIRIFNIKKLCDITKYKFYSSRHITDASYYRILIPNIFTGYKYVFYMDCDMIVVDNIDEYLFEKDYDYVVSAVEDYCFYKILSKSNREILPERFKTAHEYYECIGLSQETTDKYYNCGFLAFNIEKCKEFDFTEKCFDFIRKISESIDFLYFHDQDVINAVCKGNIGCLPYEMNILVNLLSSYAYNCTFPRKHMLKERDEFIEIAKKIKVMHFCGMKPWKKPQFDYSNMLEWWKVAKDMPLFKTRVLFENLSKNVINNIIEKISEKSEMTIDEYF